MGTVCSHRTQRPVSLRKTLMEKGQIRSKPLVFPSGPLNRTRFLGRSLGGALAWQHAGDDGVGCCWARPSCADDCVVSRVRAVTGDVLLFSSGHFLRVFAARRLGLDAAMGRYFLLSTASLSALGYEHNLSQPVIRLWDDTRHVGS